MKYNHVKHYWNGIVALNAIKEHFEKKCFICGKFKDLDLHHIIPRSWGGRDTIANLQLLCKQCHKKIHKQMNVIYPQVNWYKTRMKR